MPQEEQPACGRGTDNRHCATFISTGGRAAQEDKKTGCRAAGLLDEHAPRRQAAGGMGGGGVAPCFILGGAGYIATAGSSMRSSTAPEKKKRQHDALGGRRPTAPCHGTSIREVRPNADGHVAVQSARARRGRRSLPRVRRPSRAGNRKMELREGRVTGDVPTGCLPVELKHRRRGVVSTRRRRPGDGPGYRRV